MVAGIGFKRVAVGKLDAQVLGKYQQLLEL